MALSTSTCRPNYLTALCFKGLTALSATATGNAWQIQRNTSNAKRTDHVLQRSNHTSAYQLSLPTITVHDWLQGAS